MHDAQSPSETGSSLPRLESQLCFALYSVTHAVGRSYAPLLAKLGVTYPQYIVLLVLWERDDIGVNAIGRRLFLDSGTLTPLLKRLEQAGLIARRRDRADERQVRVRLTQAGEALREKARGLPEALGCAMGRTPEDLGLLRDDLLRLRASLVASLQRRPDETHAPIGLTEPSSADAEIVATRGEDDAS